MPAGPILIFDKSALESLSVDETNWLDNFFLTNITPLFFAETLADLTKEVRAGRTPEDVVGLLALRTPDMQAYPCAHHAKLIGGSLLGLEVPMDGRIPCNAGKVVSLDGKSGIFFEKTREEEALERWYKGEFLDIERQIAKVWRRQLCNVDHTHTYSLFQTWFPSGKPKNLAEVKNLADAYIDGSPQEASLRFGMDLFNVSPESQMEIFARWEKAGKPPIREFAPYFRHAYGVDLFFLLGIASDQISRDRPAGKADNKVDISYLYYLPFCHVFTSRDKLHKRVVPLFLREDQSFIWGDDLKAELQKLDTHYSGFSDQAKNAGFHELADFPPEDDSFLTTQIWDKHLPGWRKIKAEKKPIDHSKDNELIAQLNRIEAAAQSSEQEKELSVEETQFVQYIRNPRRKKGKWVRYPQNL